MIDRDDLRYPVGRFNDAGPLSRDEQLETLRHLPEQLRTAVQGLSERQLDVPYREDGWNSRQMVHHVADSHANAYIRIKLALTEDNPTIKPYDEAAWARLADSRMPVEISLAMVAATHGRLVTLLETLTAADYERTFVHPQLGPMTIGATLALYAWHSRHHLAHITRLRARMDW